MTPDERLKIQNLHTYLVAHKARIGYRMLRPMGTHTIATMTALAQLTVKGFEMDCSEAVTLVCHVAGVHDPNGRGYDGYGNTETMLDHLPHYLDPKRALPGALLVFNSNLPLAKQHVAQVHTKDPLHGNPVVFTHGTAADPSLDSLVNLQTGFAGVTAFLSVAGL